MRLLTEKINLKYTFLSSDGVSYTRHKDGEKVELSVTYSHSCRQGCGADYVKTTQSASRNAEAVSGRRHAAVDGDADRIVYFYFDEREIFHLLDGDKISSLVAKFLKELLEKGIVFPTRLYRS